MPFLIGIKDVPQSSPKFGQVALCGVPGKGVHIFGSVDQYNLLRNVHNDNQSRLAGPGDGYPWPDDLTKVARYNEVTFDNVVQLYSR